jgi:assimilatory nitrate reductase catalytic subunit
VDHPDRLLTPLVRDARGEPLRPANWGDALDGIAAAIQRSQERYGRDSVGRFGGGGLTNEKAYALGKFARVALGSAMIDYNGRFCMSSAATAMQRSLSPSTRCVLSSPGWSISGPRPGAWSTSDEIG